MPHHPNGISPAQSHILSELERGAVLSVGTHGIFWLARNHEQRWQSKNAVKALIKKGLIVLKPLSSSEYVKVEGIRR